MGEPGFETSSKWPWKQGPRYLGSYKLNKLCKLPLLDYSNMFYNIKSSGTLGKSSNFSEPQFTHLQNDISSK